MGYVRTTFKIRGEKGHKVLEGIVDTGAIYTVIPREILEEIGVKSTEKRKFVAFGGEIERELGEAVIELMGRSCTTKVIFGESRDLVVIGTYTLEGLGLEVDPISSKLKEATLYLLSFIYKTKNIN